METRFEGGCLCGAVRYVLAATPNYVYFCNDPSWVAPDRHLFVSRTHPWLEINERLKRYERDC